MRCRYGYDELFLTWLVDHLSEVRPGCVFAVNESPDPSTGEMRFNSVETAGNLRKRMDKASTRSLEGQYKGPGEVWDNLNRSYAQQAAEAEAPRKRKTPKLRSAQVVRSPPDACDIPEDFQTLDKVSRFGNCHLRGSYYSPGLGGPTTS